MTLSDLSNIGSLVSGLGVLASLIFVGVQLKQNTRAVRAAASQAHTANWQAMLTPIIEHEDVARIYRKGLDDFDSLTTEERVRYIVLLGGIFRFVESARLQWLHGQLEEAHWRNTQGNMIDTRNQPGFKSYWAIRRHWYSADFQAWYDALPVHQAHPLYAKPEKS